MFFFGFLQLVILSMLAFSAAVAVVLRAEWPHASERFLAAMAVWSVLILAPIHTLGFSDHLTRETLALSSLVLSGVVLAIAIRTSDQRVTMQRIAREIAAYAAFPYQGLVLALRAKSPVVVCLLLTYGLLLWTSFVSYVAPSDGWDGLWYHESMVGFAIQKHGYEIIKAHAHVTPINAFPRNCEMTSLWFVIFTDKRLIDCVQLVFALPALVGTYVLAKRYCNEKVSAMGFACALALMPGFALQLHSNYIDIHVLSFYVTALHFLTREKMQLRDGWLAAIALGLLLGGKSWALGWIPVLAPIGLVRLVHAQWKTSRTSLLWSLTAMPIIILAIGSLIYVRNWSVYGNPVWPYAVSMPRFGISFPGPESLSSTDFHHTLSSVFSDVTAPPKPGYDYPDTKQFGYGLAIPFLFLPLGVIAFALALGRAFLDRAAFARSGRSFSLIITTAGPLISGISSPALWLSRYNLHVVVGLLLVIAWLGYKRPRVADALTFAACATGAMWLYWAEPAWFVNAAQAIRYAKMPASERATYSTIGWSIDHPTALARERELGAGDITAFSEDGEFYAQLWNEHFSNRLEFVPMTNAETMMERLDAMNAKWFVTSTLTAAFDSSPRWQRIGAVSGAPVIAYRKVKKL
jgi:hypothetical protein